MCPAYREARQRGGPPRALRTGAPGFVGLTAITPDTEGRPYDGGRGPMGSTENRSSESATFQLTWWMSLTMRVIFS